MHFSLIPRLRFAVVAAAAASLVLTLSACAPATGPAVPTPPQNAANTLPSAHIHGLSVNGETGQVLLATHEGLYDVSKKPAVKVGPTNDLMGFAPAMDQGVFYASGHPGQGSSLPSPLGLIKTSDGGKTWEQLSRQNESDFHALTTTKSGIVAFDGALRTSTDGKTWKTVAAGFMPAVLAGNPYSDTVLATTQEGVQRSTDGGATWALDKSAPIIQFAAFASAKEAIGAAPDGTVYYSEDAGSTWKQTGKITGEVQAVAATEGTDGNPWIWAATSTGLVVSTDGGTTFRPSDAD
ncbi:F510_1955 family glycosylhydrolase [Pseudarthrobacter sp. NIBRBAC000502770]|uniref:F510_1955 family glycosylhydrolase n=1 Tax=Pseudarthrobacter sp. NIBRBAC000502770 TaxID=2590785 RepID=UPI00113FDFDE|nr:exo-alpha-sialidase [Pseudarthrobacter sp. NIBRBAC000502770]QDG87092.1 exo-alpha-sialidase [Pseudarthrobacter sp. NIBRBAC000502770]